MSETVVIPPDAGGENSYEAAVDANDPIGVRVRLRRTDVLRIDTISGFCSFSTGSKVKRIAGMALSAAVPLAGGVIKTALETVKKHGKFSAANAPTTKGKARDGYGQVQGKREFAAKEGGIIVCMPSAGGPIYADGETLDDSAEKDGRLPRYVHQDFRDRCFFPCRKADGLMEMPASKNGTAYILAFDAKHEDNAGVYVVEFTVIRHQ